MLQELTEKVDTNRPDWHKDCYNSKNVTIDTNPWQCLDKPVEEEPQEEEETPIAPNNSKLLKTLK